MMIEPTFVATFLTPVSTRFLYLGFPDNSLNLPNSKVQEPTPAIPPCIIKKKHARLLNSKDQRGHMQTRTVSTIGVLVVKLIWPYGRGLVPTHAKESLSASLMAWSRRAWSLLPFNSYEASKPPRYRMVVSNLILRYHDAKCREGNPRILLTKLGTC